ncbi:MAG: hypothetical protein IIB59_02035, partial [Planctomycetes bacterium]|nr:hypothetical protein [Planctomycetota bacterium]
MSGRISGRMMVALAVLLVAPFTSVARAQVANAISYQLNPGSTYQTGCFSPCTCPLSREFDLTGTFTLICTWFDSAPQGGADYFAIRDVEWTVSLPDSSEPPVTVTGLGTYELIGIAAVTFERMRLNLKIGDAPSNRLVSRSV